MCHYDNFNPHSRKGSDSNQKEFIDCINISIHTPARGVTDATASETAFFTISIHTPARGVTVPLRCCRRFRQISIHTPARGVTEVQCCCLWLFQISIHTPARGVTQFQFGCISIDFYFNPHSRKGSDGKRNFIAVF